MNMPVNDSISLLNSGPMKYLIKPLTKKMLAQLRNARAIELSDTGRNICVPDDFKGTLAGLYRRGFVNTKMTLMHGKEMLSVFITREGINFLNKYEEDKKNLSNSANSL
jgi:hypothetical protein